ncbi:MAG TPA: hypothetical protein VL371_04490 [Gemmataceae bacterium]|jgi:hypothetical protein|nr:hypothetical protein [Gemmataceae bacterium]
MSRFAASAVLALILATSGARPADPAGSWRMALPAGDGSSFILLIALENKGGQWSGKYLGGTTDAPQGTTVERVRVTDDRVQFVLKNGDQELPFDGKLPAVARKIAGSFLYGGRLVLTALEPSKLTAYDRFELLKELVTDGEPNATFFDAAVELLRAAGSKQVKADEVRAWAERTNQAAEAFGVRWQQAIALRMAQALAHQKEYAVVALAQAQRAEKLLDPGDPSDARLIVLEVLFELLRANEQTADRARVKALIEQTEVRDYEEYQKQFPFKPDPYPGRQGPGTRVVLVEMFTGAECPPCVAADLAYDGIGRTYKPSEVLRLQYHLNIPFPDPLTNATTLARQKYYGVNGTPAAFVNGKTVDDAGGPAGVAVQRFTHFRRLIDPILELPALAKLNLTAARDGDKITIRAKVSELVKPGERMRLRVFLAEDVVRYRGGNGVRYHHAVVRSVLSPETGFPLRQATTEHSAELNLGDLRKSLAADLEKFQKEYDEVPNADRLLSLKKLFVIALIQDDGTREVVQAGQAEIKESR